MPVVAERKSAGDVGSNQVALNDIPRGIACRGNPIANGRAADGDAGKAMVGRD